MYLKALLALNYEVIYVTRLDKMEDQSVLNKALQGTDIIYEYMDFTVEN